MKSTTTDVIKSDYKQKELLDIGKKLTMASAAVTGGVSYIIASFSAIPMFDNGPKTMEIMLAVTAFAGIATASAFLYSAAKNLTFDDIKQAGQTLKEYGNSMKDTAKTAAQSLGLDKEQAQSNAATSPREGGSYWAKTAYDTLRVVTPALVASSACLSFGAALSASNVMSNAPVAAFVAGTVAVTAASIYASIKSHKGLFDDGPDKVDSVEQKKNIEYSLGVSTPRVVSKKEVTDTLAIS
jgi:hypothetical protein